MQNKSILFLILFFLVGLPSAFAQTADKLADHQCISSDQDELQCTVCAIYCENSTGKKDEFVISKAIGRIILARVKRNYAKTACGVVHARSQFHATCTLPKRDSKKYGSLLTSVRAAKEAFKEGPDVYCSMGAIRDLPHPGGVHTVVLGDPKSGLRLWECKKPASEATKPLPSAGSDTPGASDKPKEEE